MLAVVYFFKTNLDKVNLLKEKYDMNWKITPPHITIVSPVSELTKDLLIGHIEAVAKNHEPFPIRLTGLTKTPDGCLFLMVDDGKDKIVTLHDKLYSGMLVPYLPTTYQFAPHITLGDFAEPNEDLLTEAYTEAKSQNLDLADTFDALTVIEGDGTAPAKVVKVINLPIGK
jgi:2'-5' RNA ligase